MLVTSISSLETVVQETYQNKYNLHESKDKEKTIQLEHQYINFFFNKKLTFDELLHPNLCNDNDDHHEPEPLKDLIETISGAFYRNKKNKSRVAKEDFISACYQKAWKTIISYNYQNKPYLYQEMKRNLKHACIDVLRIEGLTIDRNATNKHTGHHSAVEYTNKNGAPDSFNLEVTVILRDSLECIAATLSPEELKLYNMFLNADNVTEITLDAICKEVQLKHRQQGKRLLEKLRLKLHELKA